MKVKCYVCRHEEVDVEIPNDFIKLAQPHPWTDPECTAEMYEACCLAVEKATGIPFGDEDENGEVRETFIATVSCAEPDNDNTMLEY